MQRILPVASAGAVRGYARELLVRHRRQLAAVLAWHALAAAAGIGAPLLLGYLVKEVEQGTVLATIDRIALGLVAFVLAQAVLTRFATLASARLGENVLATLREEFVQRVLALPLSVVERAGTGDLVARTSRDVASLSHTVRFGVPEILTAMVVILITAGALIWVAPTLALLCLVGAPFLYAGTRWYLRRARDGYLRENATGAMVMDGLAETVEGARTAETMRLQQHRVERTDRDLRENYAAERYTLRLRSTYFPTVEVGFMLPVAATLLAGGWFYLQGWVGLEAVVSAIFLVQRLTDPVGELLGRLDELQVGGASLARLLGVAQVAGEDAVQSPEAVAAQPDGEELTAQQVRYAYVSGRDVLHGVDLNVAPGERLAMVGPSGAGKSTLGRLLAGIDAPRVGSVAVGGRELAELPLHQLRSHVALVTQEHHVFIGTLRDNLALARPDANDQQIRAALVAVDALSWVDELPDGLNTELGGGGRHEVAPAQAQQLALARLVLADPHTLVLDEATSLIDPRAARQLERSLAAVLDGRTVIAIAHRLFSAHDADRVAVIEDGKIAELGSHDELIAAQGSYAALWRSWHA